MSVTEIHVEKETLAVAVNLPGHEARATTPLFTRTRKALLAREGGRCWICGRTEATAGPLHSHHYPIERSLANMIDWARFQKDCEAGLWGPHAQAFDWKSFDPANPYSFVDDQTVNGLLLCRDHHIGANQGVHAMPHPLWLAQKYGIEGYRYSDVEIIHHQETP